jgi:hypothetical protein
LTGSPEGALSCTKVAARELPRRSLLCLKRNADVTGLWALGKEFIGIAGM